MFEPLVILFIIKNLLICNGLFFLFSIVESLTFLPIFSVFVKIPDVLTFIKCKEFLERITVKASLNVFPYFSYFNKCCVPYICSDIFARNVKSSSRN